MLLHFFPVTAGASSPHLNYFTAKCALSRLTRSPARKMPCIYGENTGGAPPPELGSSRRILGGGPGVRER